MAKSYLLSETALEQQRDINAIVRAGFRRRRPTNKRRRHTSIAQVTMAIGTAIGQVSGGNFSMDNVEFWQGGDEDIQAPTDSLAIDNSKFTFDIDDGGNVLAVRPVDEDIYYAIQALCPS